MQHSFDTKIAETVGVHAAIILNNIAHWVVKNATDESHYHDGYYWTYSSITAFEKLFPYMTRAQIRYALKKLEEAELIIKGDYNSAKFDRTMWYTLSEKAIGVLQLDRTILPCACANFSTPIPDINPDINTIPPYTTNVVYSPKGDTTPQEDIPSPKKSKRFMPPTVEEVAAYCKERGNKVDAEAFVAHYKSKGWKVGREPMRDWKAAVITWERRAKEREELPRAITSPPQRRNPAVLRSRQYSTDELSKMGKELLEDT